MTNMHALKAGVGLMIALGAGAPVAVATAASRAQAPARRHAASVGACTPGQLAVWIDPRGLGTAGGAYYHLRFTNISTRSCTLYGYPGVSAVNSAGRQLGHAASRSPAEHPARVVLSGVTLARGGPVGLGSSATADVLIEGVQAYPSARCGRATAVGLRVYAPGEKTAKFVAYPFLACARPNAPYLSVQAVHG